MSDKSLGILIFAIGLLGSVAYTFWLFWPADSNNILFYVPNIGRWAIVLPLFIAVIGIFAIGMWVGWTMMVTPPPVMVEEEVKSEEKEKA